MVVGHSADGGALCLIGGRHRAVLRNGEQSADSRRTILTLPSVFRCVYRAELILGWQIVYLSYKDTCPTISIHKRYIQILWTPMDNDGTTGKCARAACARARVLYRRWRTLLPGDTGGQSADNPDFTVCIIRCVYHGKLIIGR